MGKISLLHRCFISFDFLLVRTIKIIYLEVPYKRLKKQNSNREYPVPLEVIDRLFDKLEIPDFEEGHEVMKNLKKYHK